MAEVRLLVERGLLETERVDNVDDGLLALVSAILVAALGGGVGASVESLTTDGDLGAVGLVNDAVDELQVVRVGDELIAADNVLREESQFMARDTPQSVAKPAAAPGVQCKRTL